MIAAGPVGFTMTSVGAIMLLKEYPMPMSATTTIGGVALTALGLWNALRRE